MAARKPLVVAIKASVDGAIRGMRDLARSVDGVATQAKQTDRAFDQTGKSAEDSSQKARTALSKLGVKQELVADQQISNIEKQKAALKQLRNAGDVTADEYVRAMKSAENRIAAINKSIGRDTRTAFDKMAADAKRSLASIGNGLRSAVRGGLVGGGAAVAGAGILGAIIGRNVSEAAAFADAMTKLSRQTNIGVETLSAFAFAAEQSGVASGTFARAINNLRKNASDGKDIFQELGIAVKDSGGNFRSLEDLIPSIADRLNKIADPIARARAAAEIFGEKAGPEMATLISLGSKGINDYVEAAKRFGIVIDQESGEAAERFNDRLDDLNKRFRGLRQKASAPFFDAFAKSFASIGVVIDENRKAIQDFANTLASGLLVVVQDFVALIEGRRGDVKNQWVFEMVDMAKQAGAVFMNVLLPAFREILSQLSSLSPTTSKVVGVVLILGAVLTPVVAGILTIGAGLLAIGKYFGAGSLLMAGVASLLGFLKAMVVAGGIAIATIGAVPVAIGAAIIAALVAVGAAIYYWWDEISAFVTDTIPSFFTGIADGLGDLISRGLDLVKQKASDLVDWIASYLPDWLTGRGSLELALPTGGIAASQGRAAGALRGISPQPAAAPVNITVDNIEYKDLGRNPDAVAALSFHMNQKSSLRPTKAPRTFR